MVITFKNFWITNFDILTLPQLNLECNKTFSYQSVKNEFQQRQSILYHFFLKKKTNLVAFLQNLHRWRLPLEPLYRHVQSLCQPRLVNASVSPHTSFHRHFSHLRNCNHCPTPLLFLLFLSVRASNRDQYLHCGTIHYRRTSHRGFFYACAHDVSRRRKWRCSNCDRYHHHVLYHVGVFFVSPPRLRLGYCGMIRYHRMCHRHSFCACARVESRRRWPRFCSCNRYRCRCCVFPLWTLLSLFRQVFLSYFRLYQLRLSLNFVQYLGLQHSLVFFESRTNYFYPI